MSEVCERVQVLLSWKPWVGHRPVEPRAGTRAARRLRHKSSHVALQQHSGHTLHSRRLALDGARQPGAVIVYLHVNKRSLPFFVVWRHSAASRFLSWDSVKEKHHILTHQLSICLGNLPVYLYLHLSIYIHLHPFYLSIYLSVYLLLYLYQSIYLDSALDSTVRIAQTQLFQAKWKHLNVEKPLKYG